MASIIETLPEKKTRIGYRISLPSNELKRHLSELVRLELIYYDYNSRMFFSEDKGQRYLSIYKRMEKLANDL